jgi:hypothetical protein
MFRCTETDRQVQIRGPVPRARGICQPPETPIFPIWTAQIAVADKTTNQQLTFPHPLSCFRDWVTKQCSDCITSRSPICLPFRQHYFPGHFQVRESQPHAMQMASSARRACPSSTRASGHTPSIPKETFFRFAPEAKIASVASGKLKCSALIFSIANGSL